MVRHNVIALRTVTSPVAPCRSTSAQAHSYSLPTKLVEGASHEVREMLPRNIAASLLRH